MSLNAISENTYRSLTQLVYQRTGVHLDDRKRAMMLSRMRRQALRYGHADYESYLRAVRAATPSSEEARDFVDAATTHKTSFFRNRDVWRHLYEEVLPAFSGRAAMRWWSAACSTGQEVASAAILCEAHRQRQPGFRYRMLASDVSPITVETAAAQTFERAALERAPAPKGVDPLAWVDETDGRVALKSAVRRNLRFQTHNLLEPLREEPFDVVMVRNVLIYFTDADLKRILNHTIDRVRPGGLFLSGDSESPLRSTDRLEFLGACVYRRIR